MTSITESYNRVIWLVYLWSRTEHSHWKTIVVLAVVISLFDSLREKRSVPLGSQVSHFKNSCGTSVRNRRYWGVNELEQTLHEPRDLAQVRQSPLPPGIPLSPSLLPAAWENLQLLEQEEFSPACFRFWWDLAPGPERIFPLFIVPHHGQFLLVSWLSVQHFWSPSTPFPFHFLLGPLVSSEFIIMFYVCPSSRI